MKKVKVVFPFVEAGFGHIMASRSICDAFEKKYGEYFEVVKSNFFSETGEEPLAKFEKMLCDQVRDFNKHIVYGYFVTLMMQIFGAKICSWFVMKKLIKNAYEKAMKHMQQLDADVVVSTHWATNYYAEQLKDKPYTITYVPDAHVNEMFAYPCDVTLIGIEEGYQRALRNKKRYNKDNLKLTPLAIREEAFQIERDKTKLRQKLNHADKFTVYVTEGGYGVGMMEKLCQKLLEKDLPISLIAVCGKNPALYERLKTLKPKNNTSFYPYGFCENALEMIASSNLYLGKSGSGILEPAFFEVPIIITHSANVIEKRIAEHYVMHTKNAKRIFEVDACVEFIANAVNGGEEYQKLTDFTVDLSCYGGEGIADIIFEKLNEKFHVK